ncbi:MAG: hypothetical protein JWM91_5031 [Rhodospirillales bacterium]|nr:hypothetical protein [Rhodospirillales bacterium]
MSFRLISGIAAFASLMFGYDTVMISGALLFIRDVMSARGPAAVVQRTDHDQPELQISDGLATHGTFASL